MKNQINQNLVELHIAIKLTHAISFPESSVTPWSVVEPPLPVQAHLPILPPVQTAEDVHFKLLQIYLQPDFVFVLANKCFCFVKKNCVFSSDFLIQGQSWQLFYNIYLPEEIHIERFKNYMSVTYLNLQIIFLMIACEIISKIFKWNVNNIVAMFVLSIITQ